MGICLDRQRMEGRQARAGTQGPPELFLHCPPAEESQRSQRTRKFPAPAEGGSLLPQGLEVKALAGGECPCPSRRPGAQPSFPRAAASTQPL